VPKTKPSYSTEFKREVLAYKASTGQSQKEVADHFGITPNSLRPALPTRVPRLNCAACAARTASCRCAARF